MSLGIRVNASYIDGKGYKETVTSASTAAVTLPGNVNTAPTIVFATQFNGICQHDFGVECAVRLLLAVRLHLR